MTKLLVHLCHIHISGSANDPHLFSELHIARLLGVEIRAKLGDFLVSVSLDFHERGFALAAAKCFFFNFEISTLSSRNCGFNGTDTGAARALISLPSLLFGDIASRERI